jgi:hypothetical protein
MYEMFFFQVENGEYWRLLSPGTYRIRAVARDGSESRPVIREVKYEPYKEALRVDLKIVPSKDLNNVRKNIQVEFSLKTGTSTALFNTRKNHNSDTNTILPLIKSKRYRA